MYTFTDQPQLLHYIHIHIQVLYCTVLVYSTGYEQSFSTQKGKTSLTFSELLHSRFKEHFQN